MGSTSRCALPKWTQSTGEELANSISHGIGLVGAMIGTPILLLAAFHHGSISFLIGTIVFTVTMLLLYLGSTLYHAWPQTPCKIHPASAGSLRDFFVNCGNVHAVCAWSVARSLGLDDAGTRLGTWPLCGVFIKATRGAARHEKLAMALYLGMGWLALVFIRPLALGGSVFRGALACRRWNRLHGRHFVLCANKRLRYSHFVWHLFVLTGTGCHFAAVLICAL